MTSQNHDTIGASVQKLDSIYSESSTAPIRERQQRIRAHTFLEAEESSNQSSPSTQIDESPQSDISDFMLDDEGESSIDETGLLTNNQEKSTADEWPISKIIDKRNVRAREAVIQEYLVVWENTWMPASQLNNAQELIEDFERRSSLRGRSQKRQLWPRNSEW
ncbi:MAG: hypothetical protein M1834_008509 [Cirrosporium novae-zelandiae]|nr:MAG: hypothetical protein M1834_008509 [Cirrosporium novae-zelandiae]